MKTLYIECNMGAAGDMLLSALCELFPNPEDYVKKLNSINIPHVKFKLNTAVKCGITGTHIDVTVNGIHEDKHMHEHHHHAGMHDIEHIISHIAVPEPVRADILSVYRLIAEAESHVHGCDIDQIHFHEVGTMDAVADITGVCMLMHELAPDRVTVSPVHVGCGSVRCAHGILPVPAPAAEYILRGVPIYGGSVQGELCTPTGAALLKYFASDFGAMPVMKILRCGCGMGTKDFDTANCVRVMLGETQDESDRVSELCCNIDDMTAEEVAFAADRLFAAGALDVFTLPAGMKKNRQGVLLTCICRESDKQKLLECIFKNTSTLGVREHICQRYIMSRKEETINTRCGTVRVKRSSGYGVSRIKSEYDDIARIAVKNDISLRDARRMADEEL